MNLYTVKVPMGTKVAIIGDVHEHEEQFDNLLTKINPSPKMLLVSVGDIYDKGWGTKSAESITNKLKSICEQGYGYVLKGNHELKHIRRGRQSGQMSPELQWFEQQPLAISFQFVNGTRLTVVHGGVTPVHTWEDLNTDVETSYLRTVDESGRMIKLKWMDHDGRRSLRPESQGVVWHKMYDGRFGYIASGHDAQKDGVPKFYNYSCNIDTACYDTGILTGIIYSEQGREDLFMVTGPARKPRL